MKLHQKYCTSSITLIYTYTAHFAVILWHGVCKASSFFKLLSNTILWWSTILPCSELCRSSKNRLQKWKYHQYTISVFTPFGLIVWCGSCSCSFPRGWSCTVAKMCTYYLTNKHSRGIQNGQWGGPTGWHILCVISSLISRTVLNTMWCRMK